jgi:hypothetical protein
MPGTAGTAASGGGELLGADIKVFFDATSPQGGSSIAEPLQQSANLNTPLPERDFHKVTKQALPRSGRMG